MEALAYDGAAEEGNRVLGARRSRVWVGAWLMVGFMVMHAVAVDPRPMFGFIGQGSFYVTPKLVSLTVGVLCAVIAIGLGGVGVAVRGGTRAYSRERVVGVAILAALGFAASAVLATETPTRIGFFGFDFRFDGAFLFLTCLLISGAMARLSFLSERAAYLGIAAYAGAAVLVGGIAVAQAGGFDVWAWLGVDGLGARPPRSTLGNSGFVSVLAATAAILVVNLLVEPKTRGGPWRGIALLATSVYLWYAAIRAGSVAAEAALYGVFVVWLVAVVVRLVPGWGRRYAVGGVVGVVMAFALGLVASPYLQERAASVGGAVIENSGQRSWEVRRTFMGVASRAIAQQPLRPYGVGSFTIMVWRSANEAETARLMRMEIPEGAMGSAERIQNVLMYRDPVSGEEVRRPVIHDKVHNYLLDLWIAYGVVPTALLVVLLVSLFVRMVRAATPVTWGVASALLVYAIWAQAWFFSIAMEPLVFALLGVGWGEAERVLRSTRSI
ncbi:MAG: hypothetical protein U5K81_14235 [Trueperaceae bacterium]|nr:hypothetical protein [Trueperaceae bacterium]